MTSHIQLYVLLKKQHNKTTLKRKFSLVLVVNAFTSSTYKTKAGISLWVRGQPGLHRQKNEEKKKFKVG